jgi:hypothetical protein
MLFLMRQAILWISSLTLACGFLGCGTNQAKPADRIIQKSVYQKIFVFPYDSVWRAAQLSLHYPIAVNNMDNGVLETDWIRGVDGFIAPEVTRDPSSGIRYKLTLALVKGKLDNKESVRVTIVKRMERQRDFFSEPEEIQSDGLEEKVIFYRIERELLIDEAIKKANSKQAS